MVYAVEKLCKYLFGLEFHNVTDYQALKFIYHPTTSLHWLSAALI